MRLVKIRTEPLQLQPGKNWRLQMDKAERQISHRIVLIDRFAGKTVKQVPVHLDAFFFAPAEQANILQGAYSLFHQFENRRAQAFDAGLYFPDAGGAQRAYMRMLNVGFDFIEQVEVDAGFREIWQHFLQVVRVDDVVDRVKAQRLVAS